MPIIRARDLYLLAVIAIMTLVAPVPFEKPRRLVGAGIGSIAYRFAYRKRRRCAEGVERCLTGSITAERKRTIVQGAFREFWHDVFASPWPSRNAKAVVGLSYVDEALAAGRGVILWESSQFGGRMTSKRILRDAGVRICQVHADNHVGGFGGAGSRTSLVNKKLIGRFFERYERRFVAEIVRVPPDETIAGRRTLLRLLGENRIVCMGNDGAYGQRFVSVPFFGQTRLVATGLVTLARATGAAILPVFCIEEPAGSWRVIIEPPLRAQQTPDRDSAAYDVAVQYVTLLEGYVRRYPEQYCRWDLLQPQPPASVERSAELRA